MVLMGVDEGVLLLLPGARAVDRRAKARRRLAKDLLECDDDDDDGGGGRRRSPADTSRGPLATSPPPPSPPPAPPPLDGLMLVTLLGELLCNKGMIATALTAEFRNDGDPGMCENPNDRPSSSTSLADMDDDDDDTTGLLLGWCEAVAEARWAGSAQVSLKEINQ